MKLALVLLVVSAVAPLGAKDFVWHSGTVAKLGFEGWCPQMLPASGYDKVCGLTPRTASSRAFPLMPAEAFSPETQFLQIDSSGASYLVKWQALEAAAIIDVGPGSKVEYAVDGKHLVLRPTSEGPRHKRMREQPRGHKYFWLAFKKYKTDIVAVKTQAS